MKKIVAMVLTLLMGISVLTACGSDPVTDDFEKFLNTEMVSVNQNYETIKTESANLGDLESAEDIINQIDNKILPVIQDSVDKLAEINPETDEVKQIKGKYEAVMAAYKEGYEKMSKALKDDDEALVNEGTAKIEKGISLLDDYNKALEKLAEEKGMAIEY